MLPHMLRFLMILLLNESCSTALNAKCGMVQMVRGAATLPHGSGKVCMALSLLFVVIVCFVYSDSFEKFTFHSSLDVS